MARSLDGKLHGAILRVHVHDQISRLRHTAVLTTVVLLSIDMQWELPSCFDSPHVIIYIFGTCVSVATTLAEVFG